MRSRRLAVFLAGSAAIAAVGVLLSAAAAGGPKPLKVSCDQMYVEIDKTATRLAGEYDAKGASIDLIGSAQRCYKEGKRTRRGKGYMVDTPPIPGEAEPGVSDYYYSWVQVVTRTKNGKLRSVISGLECDRTKYEDGGYVPAGSCPLR
jgi:hypothetical protein